MIFDVVRRSCEAVKQHARFVKIDDNALKKLNDRLVQTTNIVDDKEYKHYLAFQSTEQEINYHVLYSMLQFGSGFRHPLHKHTGRV
jgi:hypothetical protein